MNLRARVVHAFAFLFQESSSLLRRQFYVTANFWRIAESIFSAKVCSCRDRNRTNNAAESTSTGTASAIAASIVRSALTGILHVAGIFRERWILQQRHRGEIE